MNAPRCFRLLNGVFAVYKPESSCINVLGVDVVSKLIQDLDSMEQRPQKNMIQYLPEDPKDLTSSEKLEQSIKHYNKDHFRRVPKNVIDWFDHPSVQGSRYSAEDLGLQFGHMLDKESSGVQLIGLKEKGKRFLKQLQYYRFPRSYQLHGIFGQASTSFDHAGKVIERSTWDHITEAKITRLLVVIQGKFRNECIKNSGLDLESQLAYEMASRGLLRPTLPTGPTILNLKLEKLNLPEFVIDVTCFNESCMYLRKLVHEIGLEMRSSAVCTKVRRYRDALFSAEDDETLLKKQVQAQDVAEIITRNNDNLRSILRKRPSLFLNFPTKSLTVSKEIPHKDDAITVREENAI